MSKRMTLDDLLQMNAPVVPGTWIAQTMGMDSTRLIEYARSRPELVPFPYQLSGNRMKVPRIPFLKWIGITDEEIATKSSADGTNTSGADGRCSL